MSQSSEFLGILETIICLFSSQQTTPTILGVATVFCTNFRNTLPWQNNWKNCTTITKKGILRKRVRLKDTKREKDKNGETVERKSDR